MGDEAATDSVAGSGGGIGIGSYLLRMAIGVPIMFVISKSGILEKAFNVIKGWFGYRTETDTKTNTESEKKTAPDELRKQDIAFGQNAVKLDPAGKMELDFSSGIGLRGSADADKKQFDVTEMRPAKGGEWKKPEAPLSFPVKEDGTIDIGSRVSYRDGMTTLSANPAQPRTSGKTLAQIATEMEIWRDHTGGRSEPDWFAVKDATGHTLVAKGWLAKDEGGKLVFRAQELADNASPPAITYDVQFGPDGTNPHFVTRKEGRNNGVSYPITPMVFSVDGTESEDHFRIRDSEKTKALALFDTFGKKDKVARNGEFEIHSRLQQSENGEISIFLKDVRKDSKWNGAEIIMTGRVDESDKLILLREMKITKDGHTEVYALDGKTLHVGGKTTNGIDVFTEQTLADIRSIVNQAMGEPKAATSLQKIPRLRLIAVQRPYNYS